PLSGARARTGSARRPDPTGRAGGPAGRRPRRGAPIARVAPHQHTLRRLRLRPRDPGRPGARGSPRRADGTRHGTVCATRGRLCPCRHRRRQGDRRACGRPRVIPGRSLEPRRETAYTAVVPGRVEYVTTSDGVRIAYANRGRGRTVVWMPPLPARHLELEWSQSGDRRWLEWLANRYSLVQYDPRGLGLSERAVTTYDLDAFERDLDAVVKRVATDAVILFAKVNSGPLAIAYAAHHPDRVSHLILYCATPRVVEGIGPHLDALVALAQQDWE